MFATKNAWTIGFQSVIQSAKNVANWTALSKNGIIFHFMEWTDFDKTLKEASYLLLFVGHTVIFCSTLKFNLESFTHIS